MGSRLMEAVRAVNEILWGPGMMVLLMGTGLFLTVRLRFLPWKNLWYALRNVFGRAEDGVASGQENKEGERKEKAGDISSFQSLMTSLAATLGTGNIVGVSSAMVLGGSGALFWMWVSALLGMATKYAEGVLAVRYRVVNQRGEMAGGPMYALERGLPHRGAGKALAVGFALFTVLASFGIGNMTQSNSIAEAAEGTFGISPKAVGFVVCCLSAFVLMGGIRSIGRVCERLVPAMAGLYFLAALVIIAVHFRELPAGLAEIVRSAFSLKAAAGGTGGAAMLLALRWGMARGIFSNEAGLGSAGIAAAAARTDHPARQGYVNMTGNFFDTLVVCTITGLVLACTGVLGITDASGALVTGAELTAAAFADVFGRAGAWMVTAGIALFAFATILGWEYYGEKALEYLVSSRKLCLAYRAVFCLTAYAGAVTAMQAVWDISDFMNGLMMIPNLICILALRGEVERQTFAFEDKVREKRKRR